MTSNRPVTRRTRIEGLDVLRGLAIFGILVVNVLQMFLPMYLANWPVEMVAGESGMWASWSFIDAFFENKFITVFSLLFGAGFGIQMMRASGSPKGFRRLYPASNWSAAYLRSVACGLFLSGGCLGHLRLDGSSASAVQALAGAAAILGRGAVCWC